MKWSNNYKSCIECDSVDRPHEAKGLCKKCYKRKHYIEKESLERFVKFYKKKQRVYMWAKNKDTIQMRHNGEIFNTPFIKGKNIDCYKVETFRKYLRKHI